MSFGHNEPNLKDCLYPSFGTFESDDNVLYGHVAVWERFDASQAEEAASHTHSKQYEGQSINIFQEHHIR